MNRERCEHCETIRRHLLEHAYDELPAELAGEVRSHLAECPACASRAAALGQGIFALNLLAGTEETSAPTASAEPLTASLLQTLAARHHRQSRRWRAVAVCAAVLAACAIGLVWSRARIEASASHLQITWGEPPPSSASEPVPEPATEPTPIPAFPDPVALEQVEQVERLREQLARQTRRLDELESFANLAGRQTLETDNRLSAAVGGLSRAFHEHRRRTEAELADLRELGDIRWQLIRHDQRGREADLLTRTTGTAAE
jgi:hypothetical protein